MAFTLTGCGSSDKLGEMRLDVSTEDLELCEERMKLELPDSAKPIGIWQQEKPQNSIKLKIRLPRSDLDKLLESSPLADESLKDGRSASFGPNVDWWDPGRAKGLTIGHTNLGESRSELTIGINHVSRTEAVVYLAWYETQ